MIQQHRHNSYLYLIFIAVIIVISVSGIYLTHLVKKQHDTWVENTTREVNKNIIVQDIISGIGYGGFIHDFKNAILRGDKELVLKAKKKITSIITLIKIYKERYGDQDSYFDGVLKVIENYYKQLTLVDSFIDQHKNASEIDAIVRVDDYEAIQALEKITAASHRQYKQLSSDSGVLTNHVIQSIALIFFLITLFLILSFFFIYRSFSLSSFQFKKIKTLFDLAPMAIFSVNEDGIISSANNEACRLFELKVTDIHHLSIDKLTPDYLQNRHRSYRESFQRSERVSPMNERGKQFTARRLSGAIFPASIAIATYAVEGRKEAIVIVKDLTDELQHIKDANTDSLTTLPNRRAVDEALKEAVSRSNRQGNQLYVALIDIDHFKTINDEHGHAEGDLVLQKTASMIISSIRETDFLGRWGGEEFLLILEDSNAAGAVEIGEKIRLHIEENSIETGYHFTVSIGIANHRVNQTITELFCEVDSALYTSKDKGRNRTTFI